MPRGDRKKKKEWARRLEEKRNENPLWQNAWWVRVNNGPHMRTARGWRRIWRAPKQAAEQACHGEWVGETQGEEGERDRRRREGRKGERHQEQQRQRRQQQRVTMRSWSGLCILRLALRCPMSTSRLWKRSPSCILTSASETSPKTCSDSLRQHLNKVQPIIELGFQIAFTNRSLEELVVEPPVTVGLGLISVAILMSLTIFSSSVGSAHLKRGWSGACARVRL